MLNEEKKPYKDLPREEKIALATADIDGLPISAWSVICAKWVTAESTKGGRLFYPDVVYRIEPSKPSIDWSHVATEFKWLARDQNGVVDLYTEEPEIMEVWWFSDGSAVPRADSFASCEPGTCDWKDSLVMRPEGA